MPERERPDGRQEGDRLDPDAELVDDLEEDQRQDDGLRVVDGVRHRQQAQRAHRVDLDRRHAAYGDARWPTWLGQPAGRVAPSRARGVRGQVREVRAGA